MQWFAGDVKCTTGIKGIGDFVGKAFRGKATGESAIKPEYVGSGLLVLEPTYRYLLLMDASEWPGGVVLDDGLFLACESTLRHSTAMRSNFSSAIAAGKVCSISSWKARARFALKQTARTRSLLR